MATLYHIDQCHYVAMQNIYQISCMPFAVICPFCRLTFAEQPALTDKRQRHVTLVHLPKWHTIFQRGSKDFHDIHQYSWKTIDMNGDPWKSGFP